MHVLKPSHRFIFYHFSLVWPNYRSSSEDISPFWQSYAQDLVRPFHEADSKPSHFGWSTCFILKQDSCRSRFVLHWRSRQIELTILSKYLDWLRHIHIRIQEQHTHSVGNSRFGTYSFILVSKDYVKVSIFIQTFGLPKQHVYEKKYLSKHPVH